MVTKTKLLRESNGYKAGSTVSTNNTGAYVAPTMSPFGTSLNFDGVVNYPDAPNIGWRSKIARGLDATTSLSGTVYRVRSVAGLSSFKYRRKSGTQWQTTWSRREGLLVNASLPTESVPLVPSSIDGQALMNFVSNARGARSAFQGSVALGELKETLHAIRHPFTTLTNGVRDYLTFLRRNRQRYQSRRRRERFVQNVWLEYSFGWKPLVSDISDGFKAAGSLFERPPRIPVRGFATGLVDVTQQSTSVTQGHTWDVLIVTSREATVVYRGAVKLEDTGWAAKAQAFGVDGFSSWRSAIDTFVPTLWELLPYSFLVDYFTNIGDLLSACSFTQSSVAWCNRTAVAKMTKDMKTLGLNPWGVSTDIIDEQIFTPSSFRVDKLGFTRETYTGYFIPPLQLRVPGFGSTRWLNIASLLRPARQMRPY